MAATVQRVSFFNMGIMHTLVLSVTDPFLQAAQLIVNLRLHHYYLRTNFQFFSSSAQRRPRDYASTDLDGLLAIWVVASWLRVGVAWLSSVGVARLSSSVWISLALGASSRGDSLHLGCSSAVGAAEAASSEWVAGRAVSVEGKAWFLVSS